MMYLVFRNRFRAQTFGPNYYGYAALGPCIGADTITNDYIVYQSGSTIVKVNGILSVANFSTIGKGSGVLLYGGGNSLNSRYIYLDYASHEHCHYLFGFKHSTYGRLVAGGGITSGMEFSLSPWEVVKLGFINQKIVNYSNSNYTLFDYSSRGGMAGDSGEVLQVPISSDGTEFFLLANRRKISKWDKRMGGDTLADDRYQFFKNVNQEYGKGLYIYHVKGGYQFLEPNIVGDENDVDMECADGLWNWVYAGFQLKRINTLTLADVYKKQNVSYNNDSPDPSITGYTSGRDEMSAGIIFTPGSPDNFSYNPIERGTHSIYTNDSDYWYSLANLGDRWDGWNVGYNEVFSPYSSPNTNAMDNSYTGIFVWYQSLSGSTKQATIKIYRASGFGGSTALDTVLRLTPPSRPMGLRVLSCDSLPTISSYKRVKLRWNHNMEPDMRRLNGSSDTIKHYKIFRSLSSNMTVVPPDAMQYPEQYYDEIATVHIYTTAIPEYTDTIKSICNVPPVFGEPWYEYPVRYRVQAIDKYDSSSVLSDFAKTSAWITTSSGGGSRDNILEIGNENLPKEYSLKQNYPNPFNPVTNIQYDLPFDNFVTIKIYNVLGKEVATLVNEIKNAGSYIVSFNGANLSSGIYYYKIKAVGFEQVRQMALIK